MSCGHPIHLVVVRLALPELKARLTPAQVEWVTQAFGRHPIWVRGTIVAIAALLALPVFGVFRWVYGPLTGLAPRKREI